MTAGHLRRSGLLADLVDAALDSPALVVGGLPPDGRDLDLLVDDEGQLSGALHAGGFTPTGLGWLRVALVEGVLRGDVVDLARWADESLPASEVAWLRASALPLPDRRWLRRPDPVAVLLLLARRGLGQVPLSRGHAERVREVLAEQPDAFAAAQTRAPEWGAVAALAALQVRQAGGQPGARLRYALVREQQRRAARGRPGAPTACPPQPLARLRAVRRAVLPPGPARRCGPRGVDLSRAAAVEQLLPLLEDLGLAGQAPLLRRWPDPGPVLSALRGWGHRP